jgi:fused signal recognition particle receptor
METAQRITAALAKNRLDKSISPDEVRAVLAAEVEKVLAPVAKPLVINAALKPHIIMVVGVNGGGKTTTIGKLASIYRTEGRTVMIAAGDTFRAAAIDQLKIWGVWACLRCLQAGAGARRRCADHRYGRAATEQAGADG